MRYRILGFMAVLIWMSAGLQEQAHAQTQTQAVDQPGETSTNLQVLAQLSADGDGHLAGVTASGEIFLWSGKEWKRLDGQLSEVSIGSPGDIWGVNNVNNSVWRITSSGWQRAPGQMSYVAVAKGGGAVVAIDLKGQPFSWQDPAWVAYPSPPTALKQIEIGKRDNVYGIGVQDQIYKWHPASRTWKRVSGQLSKISVASDGTIGGTNSNKQSWIRSAANVEAEIAGIAGGSQAAWVPQENNVQDVSMIAADTMILQTDQNINVQKPIDAAVYTDSTLQLAQQIVQQSQIVVAPPVVLPACGGLTTDRQPGVNCDDSIHFSDAGIWRYTSGHCIILSGQLALPVNGNKPITVMDVGTCVTGTFKSIVATPNLSAAPISATGVPEFFVVTAPPTSGTTNLAASPTDAVQVMASVATQSRTIAAASSPLPGLWSDYIGRPSSAVAQNEPTDCQPTTFSDRSQYSWVEFRLPYGSTGQGIHIPQGSYNSPAYSAANRVWWGGMLFGCNWPNADPGWTKLYGDWGSDSSADTSLPSPPNPYIAYGHR